MGIKILLGIGLVMSQTLIPTFCPGTTDIRNGVAEIGFRIAVKTAPAVSGRAGM